MSVPWFLAEFKASDCTHMKRKLVNWTVVQKKIYKMKYILYRETKEWKIQKIR